MKRIIYKYDLNMGGVTVLSLTEEAQLLHVEEQYGKVCLWVLLDLEQENFDRTFLAYPTGLPLAADVTSETVKHIGTVLMHGGSFVVHIFEEF